MIHLEKGNLENLLGKAYVYSELEISEKDIKELKDSESGDMGSVLEEQLFLRGEAVVMPTIFVSSNADDMQEVGVDPIQIESMKDSVRERNCDSCRMLQYLMEQLFDVPKINLRPITIYAVQLTMPDRSILESTDADILYTGKWTNDDCADEALNMGINEYLSLYKRQFANQSSGAESNEKLYGSENAEKTYRDFKAEELKDELKDKYFSNLISAAHSRDAEKLNSAKQELLSFTRGASFFRDVEEVVRLIEAKENPEGHMKQLELYMGKINAMITENYEEAAVLRDSIRRLV